MNNIKNFYQSVIESKTERETTRDSERRLTIDKDAVKQIKTARAERKIGKRKNKQKKTHEKNILLLIISILLKLNIKISLI